MYEKYLSLFELDSDPEIKTCVIKIMAPPYEGVRVSLGSKIVLDPKTKRLNFEYKVLERPKDLDFDDKDELFANVLGGMILALIERGVEDAKRKDSDGELHRMDGSDGGSPNNSEAPGVG